MTKKNKPDLTIHEVCGHVSDGAAVRELMARIGDKWTVLLIVTLAKSENSRARFSELEKKIPGISQRMLSATLKNLEQDGMVLREVFPEVPPRVEYELTPLGKSLFEPLDAIIEWVGKNWAEVRKARGRKS